jgi:hypothetical protein
VASRLYADHDALLTRMQCPETVVRKTMREHVGRHILRVKAGVESIDKVGMLAMLGPR